MRTFSREAAGIVQQYLDSEVTPRKGEGAFAEAITQAWGTAAIQGYTDGGGDEADLESGELREIEQEIASQQGYAALFWANLPDMRKNDEGEEALARVDLYTQSLKGWYNDWALYGAKNKMVTWQYGDTDHCGTCEMLNGKRRRASWFLDKGYIPRESGSATLDCHGFRCQCRLVTDDGKDFTL